MGCSIFSGAMNPALQPAGSNFSLRDVLVLGAKLGEKLSPNYFRVFMFFRMVSALVPRPTSCLAMR